MRCERALRWFSRARDGELSSRQRRQLAAHLRTCDRCRTEYRRYRATCRWLRAADPATEAPLPARLADAIVDRLRQEQAALAAPRPTRRLDARVALGIAATLALLLWGDRLHILDELPGSDPAHVSPAER